MPNINTDTDTNIWYPIGHILKLPLKLKCKTNISSIVHNHIKRIDHCNISLSAFTLVLQHTVMEVVDQSMQPI